MKYYVLLSILLASTAIAGAERYNYIGGTCVVTPKRVSPIGKTTVTCVDLFPDVTGDGRPEETVKTLELGRRGDLKCASFILRDPTCPSDRECERNLIVDRTCF